MPNAKLEPHLRSSPSTASPRGFEPPGQNKSCPVEGQVIVSADGYVLFSDGAGRDTFGIACGSRLRDAIGVDAVPPPGLEVESPGTDGKPLTVELRPLEVEWGGRLCQLILLRDVSGQRRASEGQERRIDQLTQELAAVRERRQGQDRLAAIGGIAAAVSHEIRNPLTAVEAAIQEALTLLDRPDRRDELGAALHLAADAASRCRQIIRGTMQFAHRGAAEKNRADLNQLVRQSTQMLREELRRAAASVRWELDDSIPAAVVNGVEVQLLLINLVRNSVQHGLSPAMVLIRTGHCAEGAYVAVSDNGPGLPVEQRRRILEPDRRKFIPASESGFGLSIAAGIVADHGGRIELGPESEPGTTIRIVFPIAR